MTQKGEDNGNHRKTNSPLYGGTATTPSGSARSRDPFSDEAILARKLSAAIDAKSRAYTNSLQSPIAQRAGMMGAQYGLLGGLGNIGAGGLGGYAQLNTPTHLLQAMAQAAGAQNMLVDEPDHEGIELGEVNAWRAWLLDKDNGVIMSMVANEVWMPGAVIEGDTKGPYGLGVHAFKKPGQALSQYKRQSPIIVGRIELWGEITEHESGYRAQYGTPVSFEIIYPGNFWNRRFLKKLQRKYFGQHE